MVACARRKLLGGERPAVFHCWTRCVHRDLSLWPGSSHTERLFSPPRRDCRLNPDTVISGTIAADQTVGYA